VLLPMVMTVVHGEAVVDSVNWPDTEPPVSVFSKQPRLVVNLGPIFIQTPFVKHMPCVISVQSPPS